MTYRILSRSVIALFTVAALSFAGWALVGWNNSQPVVAAAVLGVSSEVTAPQLLPYPTLKDPKGPFVNARQFVLYNPDSGRILAQSKDLQPVPIASTTKLMTAYVISQIGNLEAVVTVPRQAAIQIGSRMNLYTGEQITVKDLLLGALLVSGNDAADALAYYGGQVLLDDLNADYDAAIHRFVAEMNEQAQKVKMKDTHYQDPAGLDDAGRSTALDLAKLAHLVNQDPVLRGMIGTAATTVYSTNGAIRHDLRNSNRLVADYNYVGVIGGKTGFTPEAGHCLISSATREGITLVAVVLSTYRETKDASAIETRKLLDYGFSQFTWN